jgi:mannose-6-phosphate isomerase
MSSVITETSMASNDWLSAAMRPLDEPLEFASYLRPQVWGGTALERYLGKSLPGTEPVGEAWEVSGLPQQPSIVMHGPFAGRTLSELWQTRGADLLGYRHPSATFPLFVKWLDCREYLSVQVHPNDRLAREELGQVSGKSEAWVVVHAEPTARVYAGLRAGLTREEMLAHIHAGTIADCLHSFVPRVGDCISLPAGTVHSAGGGVVFAEVQQPSDLTFRLYDWNRLGLDGQPRPLHLEMAMKSITWPQGPVSPVTPRPLAEMEGATGEALLQTFAFDIERYYVHGTCAHPHPGEMTIWMVLDGAAIFDGASYSPHRILEKGSTILIPAGVKHAQWSAADTHEPCCLLCLRLPHPFA